MRIYSIVKGEEAVLSEGLEAILAEIRGLQYAIGGPIAVAVIFLILAARARASALADFKTYDKIWTPVGPSLKESPSASDTLIVGIQAFLRGSYRAFLTVVFGFLAADFFFAGGKLTIGLLIWLGL